MIFFRKISRKKKLEIGRLRKNLNLYKSIPRLNLIEDGLLNKDGYLNSRQKEVIDLMIKGYSNIEMSEKLFIAPTTIKYHIKNIYKVYNVHSRGQLFEKIMNTKIEASLQE